MLKNKVSFLKSIFFLIIYSLSLIIFIPNLLCQISKDTVIVKFEDRLKNSLIDLTSLVGYYENYDLTAHLQLNIFTENLKSVDDFKVHTILRERVSNINGKVKDIGVGFEDRETHLKCNNNSEILDSFLNDSNSVKKRINNNYILKKNRTGSLAPSSSINNFQTYKEKIFDTSTIHHLIEIENKFEKVLYLESIDKDGDFFSVLFDFQLEKIIEKEKDYLDFISDIYLKKELVEAEAYDLVKKLDNRLKYLLNRKIHTDEENYELVRLLEKMNKIE